LLRRHPDLAELVGLILRAGRKRHGPGAAQGRSPFLGGSLSASEAVTVAAPRSVVPHNRRRTFPGRLAWENRGKNQIRVPSAMVV